MRYVPEKDKKAVIADLKPVYKAVNQEQAYERLLEFDDKWAAVARAKSILWLLNPGWTIGPICQPFLSIPAKYEKLFTQPMRLKECTVKLEK